MTKQSPPPLVQQWTSGRYLTPVAKHLVGVVQTEGKAPLHILLALDSGHELEIPLKPAAIRKLRDILSGYAAR